MLDEFKDWWYCKRQSIDVLLKYIKYKGQKIKNNMDPNKELSTEVSQKIIDPLSFFDKNENFVLAYKKTEKLASAVYMITGLFSENEPMKWTMRKKIGELLSFILTYKDVSEGGLGDFVYNVKTKATEFISFLEVSLRGGLVSQMNFSILKQEFLNLLNILNISDFSSNDLSSNTLSKEFFDTTHSYSILPRDKSASDRISKISEHMAQIQRMSFSDIKDKSLSVNKDNLKRSNRQTIILDLIKKKKELTIKDIAVVIKDCSEKTIQRELNSFISIGVLKRAGVRRWSKYSLA